MIVSFTQTYGDRREELYKIHLRDNKLLELKNLFDINIYSFHNTAINIRNDFINALPISNIKVMVQNRISYADCINNLLKYLKTIKATHFMFTQDDTFSNFNDLVNWNDLLYIVKSHKKNFLLSLSFSSAFFENRKETIKTPTLNLYNGTMQDWIDNGWWPMEDQPYICTIDVLERLYDKEYLSKLNVWDMELHLQREWRKKPETPRHFTNKVLFTNYNIIGLSLLRESAFRERLKVKGLL